MSELDREWVTSELSAFLDASSLVPDDFERDFDGAIFVSSYKTKASEDEIVGRAHVIEKICLRVLRTQPTRNGFDWSEHRDLALRSLAEIKRGEEVALKLGDGSPQMDAGKLHPWIWEAARPLWNSFHYSLSVQQAAVTLNANLQTKVGRRDLSETKLFQESFSLEPPKKGKPRLRFGGNDGGDSYKNRLVGASSLAQGLFSGVRNIVSHEVSVDIPEQIALEQLAAFSLLARWVDEAEVETVEDESVGVA